ncbi:xanthine dehydrogenase family protein molybdopterin-binding subunit [Pelagibius litoralis]|uniref:Xanthine dehydrogenase family protein molybdopterin-binding subunit n=1 Tax=Pelagibius litoralis TaxID=374515 RepID=A0A967KC75_9PROT|nr:xanthine dehydrogenase family protein molybdopterin-binding subunit [Pelagibius litoralis]NIA71517.1 xanthine dehydrogenase family protein molybdopterin-binding subunit [Pelagibius litoralis]
MNDRSAMSVLDKPNSYIGRSVPRPNAKRLAQGRATYVDDIVLPRMVHLAFCRSPYAHAEILSIDSTAALALPGVLRVVTMADLQDYCTPWVGVLDHLKGIKSAPQWPLANGKAFFQGEPIVAVAATSRAIAEDAVDLIEVDYKELPPVTDMETALDPDTPVIHPELGDNLCFERSIDSGDVDAAFAEAAVVVEETFHFNRHTGVTLEPRSIICDYNPADETLTLHMSVQCPHMSKNLYAKHLGLDEDKVRVICKDVGGSFGLKIHTYSDEMAAGALTVMLGRPVKFIADRLESFTTDIHARDHRVTAKMAFTQDGEITAVEMDDITGIGPYSVYPRTSGIEMNQVANLTAGPYKHLNYRVRARVVFQNKGVMCQYRGVGHPIAVAVGEALIDKGAAALGMDPAEVRRRSFIPDDAYPYTSPSGAIYERQSHRQSLDKLVAVMDYEALRREQRVLRERGIYRGIGFASLIEVTNPSPAFYGVGGARIASQDGCTIRLDPTGGITCATGVTEQGQGTETIIAQIAASAVGVAPGQVRVITGDTDVVPYGGGTWASRGAGIGGEAALQAGKELRRNILEVAGAILQSAPESLDIRDGEIVDAKSGNERMPLAELGRLVYFRGDTLPEGLQPELVATKHYVSRSYPFAFTNAAHACLLEVDVETGLVKLLKYWVVEDCGTVINPLLVAEQTRGGVVQGIGAALYEECLYSPEGQMINGSMADYLLPMAAEMPEIFVDHVTTPTETSELGAKGVGEAGTAGAPGAVMNAINDALGPLDARLSHMPFTPDKILRALGKT